MTDKDSIPAYPEELLQRMKRMLGSEYGSFEKSLQDQGWQALRFNLLKTGEREELTDLLRAAVIPGSAERVPWEKQAWYYDLPDTPGRSVWHDIGLFYIQEPSAMIPAPLLGAQPKETVLDLCAAPGGKTAQIAQAMKGEGLLVCNEPYSDRAAVLASNIERLGIRNAVVTNETPDRLLKVFGCCFDRILVDAPCSGEGMMRRHPEVRTEWKPGIAEMCAARQLEILKCAEQMLKPGGTLIYSTCTFSPEENEGVIARFLESHPDMSLFSLAVSGGARGSRDFGGNADLPMEDTVRIWPFSMKGEGHFAAGLKKEGILTETASKGKKKAGGRMIPDRGAYEVFASFYRDFFDTAKTPVPERERLMCFGDTVWLPPAGLPDLTGIRIKRCGLEMGSIRKDRFIPSHALAMAADPALVLRKYEMTAEEALKWFNGETIPASIRKGHVLMTVSGFSAGIGSCDGRQIKNHYPKGLRKNYDRSFSLLP